MRRFAGLALMVLLCSPGNAFSADDAAGKNIESNLSLIEKRFAKMVRESMLHVALQKGDSVVLRVPSSENMWLVQNSIASTLKRDSLVVYVAEDSSGIVPFMYNVSSSEINVLYTNMFRDGIFGAKKVRRVVSAGMTVEVLKYPSREILYSGSVSNEIADTVAVDEISRIESADISVTRAMLPQESGLDRLVEPFIIIGATAVAVYLLFHVRS